ncbi:hypothetical protein [Natronorubrum sp. DTA7]|uniref:hypothetical protein n=1 Tax=Natronorubrum sp. DTA7 TaxID=3447016 RepID=UPI003F87D4A4
MGELFAAESGLLTASGGGDRGGCDGGNSEDRGEWFAAAGNRAVFDALREVVDETVRR